MAEFVSTASPLLLFNIGLFFLFVPTLVQSVEANQPNQSRAIIHQQFFLFNITNSNQILTQRKPPIFQEVG